MRVLVTGGSGFIGSHVVDRLRAHGHEPRILDLVPSLYHGRGEVEAVLASVLDLDAVRAAVRGCDAVVHLAAIADVNHVVADPGHAELVNVSGTRILLEAARAEAIERVVYGSTVWVYGDSNGHEPVDEDAPLMPPTNMYTATKLAGEKYCRAYREPNGPGSTILRFGIPYGPRSRPATVVAAFVAQALAGRPLRITGDGSRSRQFVYVEDLADGVVAALAPVAAGRTYNLVGTESVTVHAIAEIVRDLVRSVSVVHIAERAVDLQSANVSGMRASLELGWTATTPFVEGVRRYVDSVTACSRRPRQALVSTVKGADEGALLGSDRGSGIR